MNEGEMVEIEIDGKKSLVPEGTTVLQAAKGLGIHIPTLCFNEALLPHGACRVCIAEMIIVRNGRERSRIDASCTYPVTDGLIVKTNSPEVQKQRKLIIELLLSRAPDSVPLNQLALEYGVAKGRFEAFDGGESNCILCGLCVRVCNELIQSAAIGIAYRGIQKKVVTPFKIASSACVGCTACAYVCPTGAIKVITDEQEMRIDNWEVQLEMKKCISCGKPFAPVIYLEKLKEEINISDEVLERCPDCKRKLFKISSC